MDVCTVGGRRHYAQVASNELHWTARGCDTKQTPRTEKLDFEYHENPKEPTFVISWNFMISQMCLDSKSCKFDWAYTRNRNAEEKLVFYLIA